MKRGKILLVVFLFAAMAYGSIWSAKNIDFVAKHEIGEAVDSLNGVKVYYNGSVSHVSGRNLTEDGYNLGLKYQCVEFVKRYYYEHFNHKMPDSYGHAKDFFNPDLEDGAYNAKRDLYQYTNSSSAKPQVDDLIVFGPTLYNAYGHVAIISNVSDSQIEIIQQNPGPTGNSRAQLGLQKASGKWRVMSEKTLGWLRR